MVKQEDKRLSGGDAVVVGLLLAFIVGWIALWTLGGDWSDVGKTPEDKKAMEDAGWLLLILLLGPPLWAGWLVSRIVERSL